MVLKAQKLCIWELIIQFFMYIKLLIKQYSQKYQFPYHHIDGDRWRRTHEHMEKHVAQCMRDDHAVNQHMDPIVINLDESSESESNDDNMWTYVFTCLLFYEYNKKEKLSRKCWNFEKNNKTRNKMNHYANRTLNVSCTKNYTQIKICTQWRMSLSFPHGSLLATDRSKAVVLM